MTWWQRLICSLRGMRQRTARRLHRLWRLAQQRIARLWDVAMDAAGRHRDRVEQDSVYARSIAGAVAELVATMVPRPTLSATIAVALAGLLGHEHSSPPPRPARPRDDYGGYTGGGYPSSSSVPPAVPGSLWDRLT